MMTDGWLTIQIPRVLNESELGPLAADVRSAIALPQVSGLVLSGRDEVFCLGLDIGVPDAAKSWIGATESFAQLLEIILTAPLPTISAVNGRAVGGGVGLAAACDYVIAVDEVIFALPELLLGLLPAIVLPVLARRINGQRIRLRALQGDGFSAATAASDGLVDEVVRAGTLDTAIRRAARSLGRPRRETVAAWRHYGMDSPTLAAELKRGATDTAARLRDPVISRRLRAYHDEGIAPWQD
jgi:enoyl-CoA hydratase/carnithine racemase